MVELISGKAEYTEEEAAATLGVSIGELRAMVRTHVVKEESGSDTPVTAFRPTDLLLLKMLSGSHPRSARTSFESA